MGPIDLHCLVGGYYSIFVAKTGKKFDEKRKMVNAERLNVTFIALMWQDMDAEAHRLLCIMWHLAICNFQFIYVYVNCELQRSLDVLVMCRSLATVKPFGVRFCFWFVACAFRNNREKKKKKKNGEMANEGIFRKRSVRRLPDMPVTAASNARNIAVAPPPPQIHLSIYEIVHGPRWDTKRPKATPHSFCIPFFTVCLPIERPGNDSHIFVSLLLPQLISFPLKWFVHMNNLWPICP